MLEAVELLFHKNVLAPLAVKVAEAPAQIEEEDALILTIGNALTTTIALVELEQLPLLPVTT